MEKDVPVNAALRIKLFLESFQSLRDQNPNALVSEILEEIYGAETPQELTQLLSDIWQLPRQLRQQLELTNGLDTSPFLEVVTKFEDAMTYLGLESYTSDFANRIGGLAGSFGMMSATLNVFATEAVIDEDTRTNLISELQDIHTLIVSSDDIDDQFKAYASQKISALIYALNRYEILGSEAAIAEAERLLGSLVVKMPEIKESAPKMEIAKKLYHVANAVMFAFNLINAGFQLDTNAVKLLDQKPTTTQTKHTDRNEKPAVKIIADANKESNE